MVRRKTILAFPHNELLHEQAAAWVVRMDNGQLNREEVQELRHWVDQSGYHKKILLDTARVWDRTEVMAGLSELINLENTPVKRRSWFAIAVPAIAASLFCLGILTYYYADKLPFTDPGTIAGLMHGGIRQYETPIGGNDVVELEDGSVITLNTATRIQVDISRTRRNITLLEGEAYFEVAHNEKVPFIVTADETVIQALGTAFSVQKLAGHRVEVTVTEGQVRVKHDAQQAAGKNKPPIKPILLRAGQLVQVSQPGIREIREITPAEIARKLLWQQKMLAFDGNTLQEVIDEFSRYTPFTINIADNETAAIRVGGYFRSDDIAGLLTSLKDNFAISVKQTATNSFELQKK